MCGILAILNNNNNTIHYDNINIALEAGRNRGPEKTTLELYNNIIFGFHRLAINGMNSESGQPMKIDEITLICNGEIFNYKELYELIGETPKTSSDCEIIIHLYKKYGIEHTLRLLDGEFAFAILDTRDKEQMIFHYARDPYGVRPLYILEHSKEYLMDFNDKIVNNIRIIKEKVFAVASELKVLHKLYDYKDRRLYYEDEDHTVRKRNMKLRGLNPYNIVQVTPGTFSTYKTNNSDEYWENVVKNKSYHTTPISEMITTCKTNSDEYKRGICEYLNYAVKKRVVGTCDRPIACLLSGGLDSSLITALVKKYYQGELETYSIGMEGSEDLRNASIVAKHLGTKHTEIVMKPDEFFDAITCVIRDIESYDTTSVRASVGNYLIGKYISEHSEAKVILNGDGSDELTGGYIYMLKNKDPIEFDRECRRLLSDIHYFDVLRSDKSISSHGLEPRTPFLDKYFVDYYLRIPVEIRSNVKDENGKVIEKYLLRQAFHENEPDLLPTEILWRKKEAFSDGVSGTSGSWYEYIHKKLENMTIVVDDFEHKVNPPKTKEQTFYRAIFDKFYPDMASIVPYFWMPKYVKTDECSALSIKNEVYESKCD